jgi:hypothetical protein
MARPFRAMLLYAVASSMLFTGEGFAQSNQKIDHLYIEIANRYGDTDRGSGALFYKGHRRYRLILTGVKLSAGMREVDLVGAVTGLETPADIQGTYHVENGGPSIISANGTNLVRMTNDKSIVIEVHAKGLRNKAWVDLAGMTITGRGF